MARVVSQGPAQDLWLLPYSGSGNFAIWAEVLRDLGGWSSDYENGAEDVELCWRAQVAGYRLGFAPDAVVRVRYRTGLRRTARQAWMIGINTERLLRDFAYLRARDLPAETAAVHALDDGGGARGRAFARGAWLATRLHYLLGPRCRRGQWISVGAEFAGRLRGALSYRVLGRRPGGRVGPRWRRRVNGRRPCDPHRYVAPSDELERNDGPENRRLRTGSARGGRRGLRV